MNYRLGFGSFVDKVVMPYVSTVPHKLQVLISRVHVPGKVWRGEQPTQKEGWKEWEGDAPEDTTGELQQETQIGWGDRVAIDIPV